MPPQARMPQSRFHNQSPWPGEHMIRPSRPLSRLITRAAYAATQLPRVAWYVGHGLAMRSLSERARRRAGEATPPRAHTELPVQDPTPLYAVLAVFLQRDLANVEA